MKNSKTAKKNGRSFFSNPVGVIALAVFAVIVFSCLAAPLLAKYPYNSMNVSERFMRPCREHLFGCDYTGRDMFSRVLYGGRATLRIAAVSTLIAVVLGMFLGITCGYMGGYIDLIIMRVMEVLSSVPSLLLVILAECLLGWGKGNFMYAMAIAAMPSFVRVTRTGTSQIMSRSYIEAARALGVRGFRMVFRHIIPNILPGMLVHVTGCFAEQILTCSIMGYVGIGINPPRAEWGLLVAEGYANIRTAAFAAVIPAAVIAVCVLSVNLIGNALRDAADGGERSDG